MKSNSKRTSPLKKTMGVLQIGFLLLCFLNCRTHCLSFMRIFSDYTEIKSPFNYSSACIYLYKLERETIEQCVKFIHKLTIKTLERRQQYRFCVFVVNFEPISHIAMVFRILF